MSCCLDCFNEMSDTEAQAYEICAACRKKSGACAGVRTLSRRGTDQTGRKALDTKTDAGTSEMAGSDRDSE